MVVVTMRIRLKSKSQWNCIPIFGRHRKANVLLRASLSTGRSSITTYFNLPSSVIKYWQWKNEEPLCISEGGNRTLVNTGANIPPPPPTGFQFSNQSEFKHKTNSGYFFLDTQCSSCDWAWLACSRVLRPTVYHLWSGRDSYNSDVVGSGRVR